MITWGDIVSATCLVTGIDSEELESEERGRDPRTPIMRQAMIWIAVERYHMSAKAVADGLGRHVASISSAVRFADGLRLRDASIAHTLDEIIAVAERAAGDSDRAAILKFRSMGATLPSIARWVGRTPADVAAVLGINRGRR